MSSYRNIGKLVSTFGVNGEMVLLHHLGKKTSLKDLEIVFIEDRKNELLPYFITHTKIKSNDELYIKLEGIDKKETAQKLIQKEIQSGSTAQDEKDFNDFCQHRLKETVVL